MTTYAIAWAVCATVAAFVVLAAVVALEIRDHLAGDQAQPEPVQAPRIPAQRQPSAAAIVEVTGGESFEEFLRELIVTPHVETALS